MTIYYTEKDEWIRHEGDYATIGITEHAVEQLGEIVFVEPCDTDTQFEKDDDIGVIESVKAASEIVAPVDGQVIEVNTALADNPGLLNDDPEGDAWFYRVTLSDSKQLDTLMDNEAYQAFIS